MANGRFPSVVIRQARGWPEQDWAAAATTLRERGLLTAEPEPKLTATGQALLHRIEWSTDERAWTGGLSALGEHGVEEIVAILQSSVRAVFTSGILPETNPTGLSHPG